MNELIADIDGLLAASSNGRYEHIQVKLCRDLADRAFNGFGLYVDSLEAWTAPSCGTIPIGRATDYLLDLRNALMDWRGLTDVVPL